MRTVMLYGLALFLLVELIALPVSLREGQAMMMQTPPVTMVALPASDDLVAAKAKAACWGRNGSPSNCINCHF